METEMPEVLLQDDDILVVNKPAGMIVNNADTSRNSYTLQNFIDENYPISKNGDNEDFLNRSGIVHRLDKETSGVIIIARNQDSFENLQKQFKERVVLKRYTALVHGKIVKEGSVNVPIGRLPWNRMRFGVISNGREAYTEFKVAKYYLKDFKSKQEILSLVDVFPKTGRTHQIRVHFQYAGFPIFADLLYVGRKQYREDKKYLKRHFLHARSVIFFHPKTQKKTTVESPLSPDLEIFLGTLKTMPA